MIHDVDYGVESMQNIDQLNRAVDSLRVNAMANLEELHQLLTKNKELANSKGWQTQTMLSLIEKQLEVLGKQI